MAGTTYDKLLAALTSKESIRLAIEAKGVECGTDVPFSQYSEKILSFKTEDPEGGGVGCGIPGIVFDFTVSDIRTGGAIYGSIIGIEKIGVYVKETSDAQVIDE